MYGVASGCGYQEVGVVLRRYIDFLILLIPTPLVSVLFCSSIPTFVNKKKIFSFLLQYFFVIYVIIFSCSINTHTGIPQKPYEGLHITKKHKQTNASYPVIDISCMPSSAGCRSRSRGRVLYRDALRAAYVLGPCPPPSRGGDLELEGGVNVSM